MKDNNVIIVEKNNPDNIYNQEQNNNKTTDANQNQTENLNSEISEEQKDVQILKFQTKLFAVLLMLFSVLLSFALVSHTSKDESNTQFSFKEVFGLFSGEPNIQMKFDTSINLLGLFGAYISDLVINGTIGITILGLPIFLFVWGLKLYKIGEIPISIVNKTNKYLAFAIAIACVIGSLANFNALQNIPKEFYGSVGIFIGTMISKTISPIGSTILFLALLFFLIVKLTSIKNKGFRKAFEDSINKFRINNIASKINAKSRQTTYEPNYFNVVAKKNRVNVGDWQEETNNNQNNNNQNNNQKNSASDFESIIQQDVSTSNVPTSNIYTSNNSTSYNNPTSKNIVDRDNVINVNDSTSRDNVSENNINRNNIVAANAPNIFYAEYYNTQPNIQPQPNKATPTKIIDDEVFNQEFRGKIKIKVINETQDEEDTQQLEDSQQLENAKFDVPPQPVENSIDNNTSAENQNIPPAVIPVPPVAISPTTIPSANISSATVIDEAVFTYQPPVNIELPKQNVYVPPEKVNPKLQNLSFKEPNLQNSSFDDNNLNNDNLDKNITEPKTITENPPITLDFSNTSKDFTSADFANPQTIQQLPNETTQLIIEVDKSEEEIGKMNTSDADKNNTSNIDRNKGGKNKDEDFENFRSGLKNPLSVGMHDEKINFESPRIDLLDVGTNENFADDAELQRNGRILQEKLQTFKINISNLEVTRGPVVTQYEFVPADGVKINKIEGLADDLSMALKAKSVHIIAPVPEKGTVGIQIPNSNPSIVRFRSVITAPSFSHSKFELPLALGKTVSGEPFVADLAKMPHLLIAGSTGSGKSVGINTIISSLLYKKHPSRLKFVIIDPKKVELTHYARLSNHFLAVSPDLNTEIVTEPQDAITILKAAVLEMEKRYTLLEVAKQRNIKDYNEKVREGAFNNDIMIDHRELPYIVVIVDELADLMLTAGKEVELPIVRLAQMARAVGIHLIIATQRPSVNVITGIIKANFPARIAYLVAQKVDSRTILDSSGAEALLGNGDMLYSAANQPKAIRIQNPFVSTDEVERICDFIGNQEGYSEPYMLPSTFESGNDGEYDISAFDPLFKQAAELIIEHQQASTSMLQRRLKVGFARAGRIMDELAAANVVGPPQGSKPRAVLMESASDLERIFTSD